MDARPDRLRVQLLRLQLMSHLLPLFASQINSCALLELAISTAHFR